MLEHHLTNRTRLPEKLETVGDHIRRRRLTLKLLQRQVAKQLGVNHATITNWETNGAQPGRTALGITQSELARRLEVDACTLARWERGEREPAGAFKLRVSRFLNTAEAAWAGGTARIA